MNVRPPRRIIAVVRFYPSYVLVLAVSLAGCAENPSLHERQMAEQRATNDAIDARQRELARRDEERARAADLARNPPAPLSDPTPNPGPPPSKHCRSGDDACNRYEAELRAATEKDRDRADREALLAAEARKRCRWQNDPAYEVSRAPGSSALGVYREQYAGTWRSRPICESGTPPEVVHAAERIAHQLEAPTP